MLKDDLWLRTAGHSNRMAQLLYERVKDLPGVNVTRPVDGNAVFATIPSSDHEATPGAVLLLCLGPGHERGALDDGF